MNIMDKINKEQCNLDIPTFNIGDSLKIYSKIIEEKTERIQAFTGIVIAINGSGINKKFTLRRVTSGQGMERIYPFYSPRIVKFEILKKGVVRRAKLYYLRDKVGKGLKIKEKRIK